MLYQIVFPIPFIGFGELSNPTRQDDPLSCTVLQDIHITLWEILSTLSTAKSSTVTQKNTEAKIIVLCSRVDWKLHKLQLQKDQQSSCLMGLLLNYHCLMHCFYEVLGLRDKDHSYFMRLGMYIIHQHVYTSYFRESTSSPSIMWTFLWEKKVRETRFAFIAQSCVFDCGESM